jgi:hypothetical protein
MTKNPLINALLAEGYIILVMSVMFYGIAPDDKAETIFIPIAMISLFVLSAAVMGYLFVYTPATLYLDGKKKDALNLFLQTTGIFAVITSTLLIIVYFI